MTQSRVRSNIVALYLVQGLNQLVSLFTFPFLLAQLQLGAFGVMNVAFATIQYGVLLTDFGFNLSAVRDLAQVRHDSQAAARVFWRVTWAKTLLMVISSLVLAGLTLAIPQWREHAEVYFWSQLYILSSVLFPIWYFQGMEKLQRASGLMVAMRILMLGLLFHFVHGPQDVALAVILQAAPQLLAGFFWLATGWGVPRPAWVQISRQEIAASLKASWPFFLSAISTSLYTSSTTVILGFFAVPAQIGLFAAAGKLIALAQGLIAPLVQAIYPRIAQLAVHDRKAALAMIIKGGKVMFAVGLIMTLGLALLLPLATPLCVALLGPQRGISLALQELLHGQSVMLWYAPVVLVGAVSYVFGQFSLLVFGYERYYSRVLVLTGILNVVLLLAFLPWAAQPALRAAQVVLAVEVFLACGFWLKARHIYRELRDAK